MTGGHRRRRASRAQFERELDDYSAILVKALADRLAEAFAAYLHQQSRAGEWGIDEARERRRCASRDAPRHPSGVRLSRRAPTTARSSSCSICSAPREVGIALTESAAMTPAASVSGLYFAHPQARYFTVGRLGEDQIAELRATRRGSRSTRSSAG